MNSLEKKATIPQGARRKVYHDTKEIVQDTSVYNFYPANATRDLGRDNYFNNPFPGSEERWVIGLTFELVKHHIIDDSANDIDSEKIMNALIDSGVKITADNDNKEFIRDRLTRYMNFEGTDLDLDVSAASTGGTAPALSVLERKVVTPKRTAMIAVPNPFLIASTQTIDVEVTFEDSSDFPTSQNWSDASQSPLLLRCNLYVAEVKPQTA